METRWQIDQALGVSDERAVALRREARSGRDRGQREVHATGHEQARGAGERAAEE